MVSLGLMYNKQKNQKKEIIMISKRLDRQRVKMKVQLAHHQIHLMIKDQDTSINIFNNDTEKLGAKGYDDRGVTEDHVMRYLWAESSKHSQLASVSGKKAC